MSPFLKVAAALALLISTLLTIGSSANAIRQNSTTARKSQIAITSTQSISTTKQQVGIYSKDSQHVYNSGGGIIPGADPATFTLCDSDPLHADCGKDASHVYLDDVLLQNADPASFVELNSNYGKDKDHVFFLKSGEEGPLPHIIAGADQKSFIIDDGYGKDANRVYLLGVSISPPVDAQTFSVISIPYLKDAQHVYVESAEPYKVSEIVGADPSTFTLLSGTTTQQWGYAKDKSHVYYGAEMIPDADLQTFQVTSGNGYDAKDKLHKYLEGEVVN